MYLHRNLIYIEKKSELFFLFQSTNWKLYLKTISISGQYLPPHVGIPIGGRNGPKYYMLEIHYDNPKAKRSKCLLLFLFLYIGKLMIWRRKSLIYLSNRSYRPFGLSNSLFETPAQRRRRHDDIRSFSVWHSVDSATAKTLSKHWHLWAIMHINGNYIDEFISYFRMNSRHFFSMFWLDVSGDWN